MKLTMAQAVVRYLNNQYVERDNKENKFIAGAWGIFGHGNVAGLGEALEQNKELKHFLPRNEQAMVHTAVAYAKQKRRMETFACTSSIGPGATNMIPPQREQPSTGSQCYFYQVIFLVGAMLVRFCNN